MTLTKTLPDFTAARKAMVDSQLRTSGVNEPFVMERMGAHPREDHVPEAAKAVAYMDRAVPLGGGKSLPAPLFHGRVLAEAQPRATDRVLVIDSGAGYLPALLAPLVESVEAISPADAAKKSRKKGDFTLLFIDGAVEEFPEAIAGRLADGARIVTGIVEGRVTRLAVGYNSGGAISLMNITEMGIPRLHEFDRAESWSF
ncbi:protein-L-isoaspartate O-methyltransferase [Sphingomonadaceae bacterium]|nr:protein-L-isoaspartate O-methyltransferase [Sphingomonadaceae bacterium]